jgi:cytochrome c-type biogenesis protein CcmH/NrfG
LVPEVLVIMGQEGREGLDGQDGREGQDGIGPARPASPALPALFLLLVFAVVVPRLGQRTGPAEDALDCSHVADDAAALERCVELRPGDVELMANLGAAYERASQSNQAEDVYRRALTFDPEDGDMRVRLAELLLRKGDAEGARREGTAALAVQPGREPALDVIRRATAAEASR